MKKTLLMVGLVCVVHTSAHAWRAYNDLAWTNTQTSVNITTYTREQGGSLTNYDTGEALSVTLDVTGGGGPYLHQGTNANAGTDADAVFGGIVNCGGVISYSTNTDLVLTFSNLNSSLTYSIAVFGNRHQASYTTRTTTNIITGADSFTNLSTAGATIATTTVANDTTVIVNGYNTVNGYVARYSRVDPGADGVVAITIPKGTDGQDAQKYYANAVMIETETSTGTVLELSQLEIHNWILGLTGLGMLLCGCLLVGPGNKRVRAKLPPAGSRSARSSSRYRRIPGLFVVVGFLILGVSVPAGEVMGPVGVLRLEVADSTETPRALVSLPFHALGQATFGEVLGDQVNGVGLGPGDRILKWNRVEQQYDQFTLGKDSKWSDKDGLATTLDLGPGEGFWVELRQSAGAGRDLYLMGEVVLSDSEVQFLYPGLSLFGHAFATPTSLNDESGLAEDGASDGLTPESADKVIEADGHAYYWLSDVAPGPVWKDSDGEEAKMALEPGESYWYWRKDIDVLAWQAFRPYADVFASSNVPPYITSIAVDRDRSEVVLTVVCAGAQGETLDVLYKDMTPEQVFVSHKGWAIAEKAIAVAGETQLEWRDKGSRGRQSIDKVHGRFYLVGRGDIDLDLNGVGDFRQRFVFGEEPVSAQAGSGEDADGALADLAVIGLGLGGGGPPMGPLGGGGGGATNFAAYNDLGWEAGELTNNITLYNHVNSTNGLLVDYSTGTELDVEVHLRKVNVGTPTTQSIGDNHPDAGSDAHDVFDGIVDCDTSTRWTNGTLEIFFTGLDNNTRYEFVMFGNRSKYADRLMDVVISDVGTYRNESSDSATVWTADRYKDTGRIAATNDVGYVWKYTQIDPDGDGDLLISVTRSGASGYINAFMLKTVASDGIYSLDTRVSTGMDDVEEASNGSIYTNSTDLELIRDTSDQTVGIRFSSVGVPAGANIASALIQFKTDETSSTNTTLTIAAQATNDAPAFTTGTSNVTTRTQTSDSVLWEPSAWSTEGESAEDQCTEDIARVIQEVVDLDGWQSSNAVAIIISGGGKRIAESYEGDADGAPLLHVEYSLDTTISFQDGVYPDASYAGTRDTMLAADNPTVNYGTTNSLGADGSPDEGILLQWDLSDVPSNAIVTEASIILQIEDPTAAGTDYEFYGMKRAWAETVATWNIADTGVSWGSAGAQGSSDRRSTQVGSFSPTNTGSWTIDLNDEGVALVQAWIEDSSANHGILIEDYDNASNGFNASSREVATAANRPKLTLTYATNTLSRTFQDGVSPSVGYAGTRDTTLRGNAPTANYGANEVVELDGDDSDETGLVKWDLSSLPSASVIESATIEVNVVNGSAQAYEFYQLLREWVETNATWNVADAGETWTTAGAQGSGDRETNVLGSLDAASAGKTTVSLNSDGVAAVQSWADGSAANEGGIFQDFSSGDGLNFDSREVATETNRPCLTVTYRYYPDQDSDALPDWWEVCYFDAATNAIAGDDDDSDELTNLEEYKNSTDPNDSDTDDDGMDDAIELFYGLDPTVSNSFMSLAFTDGFESATLGDLDGQNGWGSSVAGVGDVQTNVVYAGSNACQLVAGSGDRNLWHYFANETNTTVYSELYLRAVRRTEEDPPSLSVDCASALYVDVAGRLVVCEDGAWTTLTNHNPIGESQWIRLTVKTDHSTQKWSLWLDGVNLATDLDFASAAAPQRFSRFWLSADNERDGYFDDVSIDTSLADGDGDGLGNMVETDTGVFVSPDDTGTDPSDTDSDNDGTDDGDEVANRTDPNSNDTAAPTIVITYPTNGQERVWIP